MGGSGADKGPREAICGLELVHALVTMVTRLSQSVREVGVGRDGECGWGLVVIFIFLITVLHGDALHASLPARGRRLLHCEAVPDRVVHLAVQR